MHLKVKSCTSLAGGFLINVVNTLRKKFKYNIKSFKSDELLPINTGLPSTKLNKAIKDES